MMSIMSDEVNFLVYRYLQESGYQHSAYSFGLESHVAQSNVNGSLVPPGALVNILQKGIQFIEGELCINDDGSLVENLESLGSIPLIDAVVPESLAERAAAIYRLISEKSEINQKLLPHAITQNTDCEISLNGHKSEVFSCAWHPSCKYLATGDADGIVGVWSLNVDHIGMLVLDHRLDSNTKNQPADITGICWHPDGHYLATASALDYSVRIWDKEGTFVTALSGHSDLILTLNWNKSGSFLLSASLDKKCIIWKTDNWQILQEFQCHAGPVVDTDWQSNAIFASCSTDRTICVSKIGSEDTLKTYIGHTEVINCIKWDPSGLVLASCADDKLIKIWNSKQVESLHNLSGHTREVTQVRWSSKRLLASASYDTSVRIWDIEQALCLHTLVQHSEPVNSISFHPNGNYLASASLDGYINIWELQGGSCIISRRCNAGVFEACWNSNGTSICICMADKSMLYAAIDEAARLTLLLQCMLSSFGLEVRTMAAVLFRRLISSIDDFTIKIPEDIQELCKAQLVEAVQLEENDQLRKKLCDCTAELAKCYLGEDGTNMWPSILKFLYDCCNAEENKRKEVALHVIISFPGIFGSQQDTYLQVIKDMLTSCIQVDNPDQVRLLSARASCTFITECVEENKYKMFADIYPGILQAIEIAVKTENDDAVLKIFVELVEIAPKLVRAQLQPTMDLMLQIVSNTNLQNNWRQLALEAIVTLSETAPAMIRKHGSEMVQRIVPEMLALMVELEDDDGWSFSDDVEDTDMDSNPVAGESSLDRFTCALGGKAVLPHIISTIPPMLQHADWRYRHAALMAVSAVAEGCVKQMEPLLASVVDSVLPFLQDEHPRVRHAACNALGQLATDFGVLFQKKFHEKVMPALMTLLLNDTAHPRVQAHAAAAMVNFCEECPPKILEPYLDSLVDTLEVVLASKIQELLQGGTKLVLEQVLTTIATVADTAETRFTKYYERFMPSLKYIFENATTKDFRLLRGKSIECISLIGLAVGAEKFLPDASDVMKLLLETQTDSTEIEADDPQMSYLISAWARMCKIIGKDFVQYLPVVMPPVLKAAQIKPEVALLDLDDPQNSDVNEDDGWEFVNLGEQQKFGIKTAGLEDKSTACQMLVHYARELKEGFAEYTEQVVKIMVPLLKFYFHDTVRVTAAEALPHLLECAKSRGDGYVNEIWLYISPELLSSIEREPEEAVVPEMMESFAKCIEVLGVGHLTEDILTHLAQLIHEKLEKHLERQEERHHKRKDEDYDEEVEENLQDEHETDEYILSKVSDVMHALFKTHRQMILPFFEQLLPDFSKLLVTSRPASDRQWAICIFDDLLEYTGPVSVQYKEYFLKELIGSVQDHSPEVRQAAAYGSGVMAQFGGSSYAYACAEVVPLLIGVISHPDARTRANTNSTDNCISAVSKICKYNSSQVNVNDIISKWLTWLPVTEDHEEAPHVYGYLCDLVEANHPAVLGEKNENIPNIVKIMCEAAACEVFNQYPDVANRIKSILCQIQTNETVWKACVQNLDDRQKNALAQL